MAEKQLVERNLKFSDKYSYLATRRQGSLLDGGGQPCDNCGKLITSIVTVVRHSDKKQFEIGTDCAETIAKANILFNASGCDYHQDQYELRLVNRFMTLARKYPDLLQVSSWMFEIEFEEKGKEKKANCHAHGIKKYYPEFYDECMGNNLTTLQKDIMREGYEACAKGVGEDAGPYAQGTASFPLWYKGWLKKKKDLEDKR